MAAPDVMTDWVEVCGLEELEPGTMRTFKHGRHQLAVARTIDGAVYAVDNRCPHEGYPLAQGTLKGTALTCCWHNWKFDVRDGRCTLGGEPVRSYPTRVVAERVEVDLTEPDPELSLPAWKASFEEGLYRAENDRAIRDGVRLLQGGYDPVRLLADVAAYDARHAEYGSTHALAVAADCARFLDRHPGVEAMYAIAPAIDMCGDADRRLPERGLAAPVAAVSPSSGAELRARVEAEDGPAAEGLLRGAFAAGLPRAEIERWLYAILSDHFLDFGHSLIYLVKAQELLDRLAAEVARDYAGQIYPGLLYKIVLGTREDTLPYMRGYAQRLGAVADELPAIHARRDPDAAFDPRPVVEAVLDGSREEAFDAVWSACASGVPAPAIARALVTAAARRFYRFNVALDSDPGVAENWLWVTHRFTFASAVRNATERFDAPDALRLLFHAVMFVHSGKPMDLERVPVPESSSGSVAGVLRAIAASDADRAVGEAVALGKDPAALEELRVELEELCLRDPCVRPIVVAHAIKTTVCAFEELAASAAHASAEPPWPLLALVRFLASPLVERRVHATVGTSIRWVAEGTMPTKLTQ